MSPVPTGGECSVGGAPGTPVIITSSNRGFCKSGEEMDSERSQNIGYQYLCHLEEAKNWIGACIREEMPATTDLEESLRNGVYLAKLGHFFAPNIVPFRKIFDPDFKKFEMSGLHFKHTDNINYFLQAVRHVGLPEVMYKINVSVIFTKLTFFRVQKS